MLSAFKSMSALIVAIPLVISCSGANMSGVAGLGGSDSTKKSSDADSEDTKANAPQQVSGAFLTCAYMGTEAEVVAATKAGQTIDIGCGLYQKTGSGLALADISNLGVSTGVRCSGAAMQKVKTSALPKSSNLHYMAQVPSEQLPCALSMGLADSNHHAIAFGRSISTITQTDASHGFSAAKDVQSSGLSFAADRSPKFSSSPSVALMQDIIGQLPADLQAALNNRLKSSLLSSGGLVAPPSGADESSTVAMPADTGATSGIAAKPASAAPSAVVPKTTSTSPTVAPTTTKGETPTPVSNTAGT